ncbi:MAG TPA: type IV pilus secretin PilQ [Dissulfurispiraceae bacterium]|nr:type IV pilus secretin PilQ [Dissulfurispiraceae bacterium]
MRVSAFITRKQSCRPGVGRARMLTWLLLGLFMVCAYSIPARVAEAAISAGSSLQLTAIDVSGNTVKLSSTGSMKHSVVATADPFKLILELEGVTPGQFNAPIRPQSSVVSEITASQMRAPRISTLLTFYLSAPAQAKIEEKGAGLEIAFVETAQVQQQTGESVAIASSKAADKIADLSMAASAREITEVLLEKTEQGVELIFKTDGMVKAPAIYEVNGKLVIDVPVSSMKAALPVKMIPPIRDLKYRIERDRVLFTVNPTVVVDTQATILDDELVVDIKPVETLLKSKAARKAEGAELTPALKKKTISLDFQDADIVPILRLLGDVSGYNMVIHPEVKGRITMKLKNSPWDQALEIVLKTFALEKIMEGNVIRVMTAKAYQEEKKAVTDAREAVGRADDLVTKIFSVNNANVETVKAKEGTPEAIGMKELIEKGKVLSPRGSISADTRTRSLIVKDVPTSLAEVQKLIDQLDKPTAQVLIDARMVEVASNFTRELGIEWGASWVGDSKGYVKGSQDASGITGGFAFDPATGARVASGTTDANIIYRAVNLPTATTPAGAISFGILRSYMALEARISALEVNGKARTVSNPKILTVDNKEAVIKHGAQIPVTTRTQDGTFTTVYKDANLKLTVTPQISPDNTIYMKVEVTKDEPDFTRTDNLGNPTINSRQATTQLYMKDGETVVIGGIMKTKDTDAERAVPGLSKVPLLGLLFKNNATGTETEELLLFITPRIVRR